jgi:hypothetical protein
MTIFEELLKFVDMGGTVVVALMALYLFYQTMKDKNKKVNNNKNEEILNELKSMNSNHLNELRKCVEDGNKSLVDTIHDDNTKIIEVLGRIDGKLSK